MNRWAKKGGPRIPPAERKRIIETYLSEGREAADKIAIDEFGLDEWYAYKVTHETGRLPARTEKTR